MDINIKRSDENVKLPTKGSEYAAGLDLYAFINNPDEKMIIPSNATVSVHTGLFIEIPEGYFGAIFARSGLATKRGLRPANCVGVIDPDYRGEVIVAIHNDSDLFENIHNGDRIAQLIILPYMEVELHEVDELTITERGIRGFGSTGK